MNFDYNLSEIDIAAKKLLAATDCKIFLFYGSMGVGKTTLIKAIAKQLGVEDIVSSPTFSLVNEYKNQHEDSIYHFDFYRIKNEEEALDMGVEEYFDSNAVCLIEWPEKIKNLVPLDAISIHIEEKTSGKRSITLEKL